MAELEVHDGAAPDPPRAAFYFDLGSPEAYLVAERVLQTMPVATEWIPVLASGLPGHDAAGGRDAAALAAELERRGLQPLRMPDPYPFDSAGAMRAATFAKQIGRTVPFALAAFRQCFAAGRSLAVADNVLIAGSACEMHPAAILRALELRAVAAALADATALARERGVRDVPAVWVAGEPDRVFHGAGAPEEAAAALGAPA